jgi:PAS domain S-box-containing protein
VTATDFVRPFDTIGWMGESLDPFVALAEVSDTIVFITDLSMRMLYANAELERQTGFTAADFQFPQQDNPFIHREDAEYVAQALSAFASAPEKSISAPIDNRFLDRWGRPHRYRSLVSKIAFRGEPALLFACRSLESVKASSTDDRQYRALVESADDAIVRIDNAGRLLFANDRTAKLLGYTAVELGRLRLDDLVIHSQRTKLTEKIGAMLGATKPSRFTLTLVAKDGSSIGFHAVLTALGSYGFPGELLAILRIGG